MKKMKKAYLSKGYQQRGRKLPKCPNCKTGMEGAVLKMHFPRGTLPVAGLRCPSCREEVIQADVVAEAQKLAEKWGLYEPEFPLVRKITKSGKQLAIYLPREIERALGLSEGAKVKVFTRGDEIVVEPI